ncbi:hypothetical protein T440DRAFT_128745 [Plenodomus tracheiphilus IPT5]|uniref:Uncharacterized protein n=1 Tax=Plenodomus tracheiphilus IPT5 TaxID=1408161 RepID=A0A6A7B5C0_9PLEO|nr:hypothetical protein T440DRAFT_128745 [Plenodomus tracheiphilus IPT5]
MESLTDEVEEPANTKLKSFRPTIGEQRCAIASATSFPLTHPKPNLMNQDNNETSPFLQNAILPNNHHNKRTLQISPKLALPGSSASPTHHHASTPSPTEIAMIAKHKEPENTLHNVWWKILLLLLTDFFSVGVIAKAMACPLETMVVIVLVVLTNWNANGGVVGEFWRWGMERDGKPGDGD